ncbi:MAG: hypothetical protein A3C93_03505 [Candidatus Lloydbacteria bacterium RIFCSPHIGHO2_02_FULL_54_17]|uniref:Glycosyl hydrolase family 13 catalytic domain-containing protein n=1 Tax=Candidatus Lloydbacteria bacterium RIFCSPHIGHO2_02_FULL_54_17 TaxID=1798664 RepID=A0A1G2DHA9_9BACT|nr:MAG: hypothetical protein A2762_01030 [Candidatus Lloydbacteria bacterium RIFCSPHIGHO2_01_FULL_54_11]OGZ12351.1 MAG: hypothetical protein A3C93_03505 [Candidatus Lloydbacteria bacterium RIFCSPHIGHO2_02_FULL_54_17]OGZ14479.1 MAG: hypothetical protein A3H76_05955 [Candidatus Lloydbacteria bacterium RIFCSPLOWO2_02_FULL_54_12]OGZ14556.1 MAG: hypothetical protein A2948_05615 [Candidatus Lloydbacteria bacterium RIFCSPLOWO2_01_FULL_54_18]
MGKTWFTNAVIYQIFLDRFSRGKMRDNDPMPDAMKPEFCGGNLQGVIDHLDHVERLGANAIWITPFNTTSAYHGYHVTDFFGIDPRFGSTGDLQRLISAAHERNIKIVMDFVPNHASYKHPYFLDARKNPRSPYHDWFYFKKWPNRYECFLHYAELPKLNLDNPEPRKHVTDAALYWLSLGIDALRLDHAPGPSDNFWQAFVKSVRTQYPDTVLFGEAWTAGIRLRDVHTLRVGNRWWAWLLGSETLMLHYRDTFDALLDFEFNRLVGQFGRGKCDKATLEKRLRCHYDKFPSSFLPSFLDNHDMDRFLFTTGNDKERLRRAAVLQFLQPQPVIIYYGTEIGMSQQESKDAFTSYGDLVARQMMIWDETRWDKGLFAFFQDLIAKRKNVGTAVRD